MGFIQQTDLGIDLPEVFSRIIWRYNAFLELVFQPSHAQTCISLGYGPEKQVCRTSLGLRLRWDHPNITIEQMNW